MFLVVFGCYGILNTLIELIRRLVNETIWVLDNLCMCCNVEMVNNCSLYMRNHHYQHMVLLFVH